MKLTKMQCPNCNGVLKCDTKEKFIECPYCKTTFYLDEEKQPASVTINIKNYHAGNAIPAKKIRSSKNDGMVGVVMVLIALSMAIMALPSIFRNKVKEVAYQPRTQVKSEAMVRFVEEVFQKSLNSVTQEDYASIVYLKTYKDTVDIISDTFPWTFIYATSLDVEGKPIDPVTVTLMDCKDTIDERDLQAFPNLIRIEMGNGYYRWDEDYSYGFNLKNLKNLKYLYLEEEHSASSVIDGLAEPSMIEEFAMPYVDGTEDLTAISALTNLQNLTLEHVRENTDLTPLLELNKLHTLNMNLYNEATGFDISFLSGMTNLKSLTLVSTADTPIQNISVLHGMPQLEELNMGGIKELKNLDFISNMPKLQHLALDSCPLINISELTDNVSISSLRLTNMSKLEDVSSLNTLTGLTELVLYSNNYVLEDIPNLANLPVLTEAYIEGRQRYCIEGASKLRKLTISDAGTGEFAFTFLQTLPELTSLTFDDVNAMVQDEENSTAIIAGLPNLKELTGLEDCLYYLDWNEDQSVLFSSGSIEKLVCKGKGDIIFHIPKLRMNPANVPDNYVLKSLNMDNLMIDDIREEDHDDVAVGKYANEMLPHLKAVEELSIREVELQDLEFAADMPELRKIDLSDNYVKDLTPLASCPKLEEVICTNNPVSNMDVLPDSVHVIR